MREVQRRAGVSAATAYWHYKDRAAMLLAVARRGTAELSDALTDAIAETPAGSDLSAVCLGYLHFARDREGVFQAIVMNSSTEELRSPADAARGRSGRAAFEVLELALADYLSGEVDEQVRFEVAVHVWASCHGLAALLIDSPLAALPEDTKERLRHQHAAFVLSSVGGAQERL